MTVTYAEATTPATSSALLATLYAYADSIGVDITGVQNEAMFRALYELESIALSHAVDIRVAVALSGFLDTSSGPWLTLLAKGVYNLTRNPATRTIRAMNVVATSLAVGGVVGAGIYKVQSSGGILFANLNAFTVTPGSTTGPVLFQAVTPGTSGNLPPGTSFTNVTTLGGVSVVDLGITGSGTVAGVDEEKDAPLRTRCRAQIPSKALWGTRLAFAKIIQEAFDAAGQANTITRFALDDTNPNGPGSYDLYLGNAAGAATVTEVAIVQGYFDTMERAGSGPVRVFAAAVLNIPLTLTLYGSSNGNKATQLEIALAASVPIGGTVYSSEIVGVLGPAPGGASSVLPGLYDVAISDPAKAVTKLGFNQLPVFNPINISTAP